MTEMQRFIPKPLFENQWEPLPSSLSINIDEQAKSTASWAYSSLKHKEAANNRQQRQTRWKKFTIFISGVDSWLWEIMAAFLSVASLLALAFMLGYINERPQTSWEFRLTPNTVISLLSTTARSSVLVVISGVIGQEKWLWFGLGRIKEYRKGTRLIDLQTFDDASRGPLGSVGLIYLTKMRYSNPRVLEILSLITEGDWHRLALY